MRNSLGIIPAVPSPMPRFRTPRLLIPSVLAVTSLVPATPASSQAAARFAPTGWDSGVKLREAVDTHPDPRVVEVAIRAVVADVEVAPGQRVRAWTYDGGLPGPLIRTKVGDR